MATRRYRLDLAVQKRVYLAWRDRPSEEGILEAEEIGDASELRKRSMSW